MSLHYLCTGFENASPLEWEVGDDGAVHVGLIYDHERESPNRAVLHWHFQLQGDPGAEVRLILRNFDNVWNGRPGSPLKEENQCVVSDDGKTWRTVLGRKLEGNRLELNVRLETDALYVARIEPYRLSDLARFLDRIAGRPLVRIETIGQTVEGRDLEIVSVGRSDAPHHVLLRARAHPWETGGNWLLEGLVDALLSEDAGPSLDVYCLHAMPMANKDGVARGGHRFNMQGKDLNRNWDRPADPALAPENRALERWLERAAEAGQKPELAIDLHNDAGGQLHVSRPEGDADAYLANMERLETVLRRHTWFTEGSTDPNFRNPGSLGEGFFSRYGVDACVLELNCNWAAGLQKPPLGADWRLFGRRMREAFQEYFG
jgi:hypothetical protein